MWCCCRSFPGSMRMTTCTRRMWCTWAGQLTIESSKVLPCVGFQIYGSRTLKILLWCWQTWDNCGKMAATKISQDVSRLQCIKSVFTGGQCRWTLENFIFSFLHINYNALHWKGRLYMEPVAWNVSCLLVPLPKPRVRGEGRGARDEETADISG